MRETSAPAPVAGVICEYNPLHKGHAHHLAQVRASLGGGVLVCVMSGSWVQRGEPASCDKWLRAAMALEAGADLVIELPALYSVRAARDFAMGGIAMLRMLGIGIISFGSEIEDEGLLRDLAEIMHREPPAMSEAVREGLRMGWSHPRALSHAAATAGGLPYSAEAIAGALSQPNAMLGVEYLRACRALDWPIRAMIVRRDQAFVSASAIRAAWRCGGLSQIGGMLPEPVLRQLDFAERRGDAPAWPDALDTLTLDLMRERCEAIVGLPDWEAGLDRRLARAAWERPSVGEALAAAKCKRYPFARLRRLTAHLTLGITPSIIAEHPLPRYARVLGVGANGRSLVRAWRDAGLPVYARTAQLQGDAVYEIERRATDLQSLCAASRRYGLDTAQKPVLCGFS